MTNRGTHTPGPWRYCQESADPEWWIVTLAVPGGVIIANVNAHHHQEANARLIAAAPKLLAAVRKAIPFVHLNGDGPEDQELLNELCAALVEAVEDQPPHSGREPMTRAELVALANASVNFRNRGE